MPVFWSSQKSLWLPVMKYNVSSGPRCSAPCSAMLAQMSMSRYPSEPFFNPPPLARKGLSSRSMRPRTSLWDMRGRGRMTAPTLSSLARSHFS